MAIYSHYAEQGLRRGNQPTLAVIASSSPEYAKNKESVSADGWVGWDGRIGLVYRGDIPALPHPPPDRHCSAHPINDPCHPLCRFTWRSRCTQKEGKSNTGGTKDPPRPDRSTADVQAFLSVVSDYTHPSSTLASFLSPSYAILPLTEEFHHSLTAKAWAWTTCRRSIIPAHRLLLPLSRRTPTRRILHRVRRLLEVIRLRRLARRKS